MNILLFVSLIIILLSLYEVRNKLVYTYVFTIFWFVNLTVSELFFAEYKFSNSLYVLIISSIIFCFIGELCGYKKSKSLVKNRRFNPKRFTISFLIIFCLAMGFPIFYLINNGIALVRLFNFQSLLEVNNEMAVARYSEQSETSLISQFCLIFVYCLPLYSSLLIKFHNKKKYIYYSMVPGLIVLLTQNTKLVLMSTILSILTGLIVQNIILQNKLPKVKMKSVIFSVIGFVLFYGLMVFSFIARIGRFDQTTINIANSKIASYVAHVPALDNWLQTNNFDNIFYNYGVKTFFGITNTLGIAERKSGVFKDFMVFEDSGQTFTTNIYTVYRFLIEDFGFIGTMFFLLISAFLFALIRRSTNTTLKMSLLSMLIFFVLNSYATSIFAYFSYIVAYVVLYLSMKFVLDFKLKLL